MIRYLFLQLYSNEELCAYLAEQQTHGWVLKRCLGNFLSFQKAQPVKKPRLCVAATECSKRRPEEDEEVAEYVEIAERRGWKLLCIGDFEGVLPMRRRLYFQAQDKHARALEPDEVISYQFARRAHRTAIRWGVCWTLLALASLFFSLSFMGAYGAHPALLLVDAALTVLACASLFLLFDRRALYRFVTKKGAPTPRGWKALRTKECALEGGLVFLLLCLLFLMCF